MDPNLPLQKGIAGEDKEEHLTPGGNSYQSIQAANTKEVPVGLETEIPQKSSFEKVVQELHKDTPIQNLRTYESDLADMVKDTHVSKVSIGAQKIQHPQTDQNQTRGKSQSIIGKTSMVLGSLILILASIAIVVFVMIKILPKTQVATRPVALTNNIIGVNDVKTVSVNPNETTFAAFLGARNEVDNATAANGSIVQVIVDGQGTTTPLDLETFLADSGAKSLQNWFIRSLGPNYLIGFYNDNSSWKPFMMFQILSYDNAFAGMLNWENGMGTDLAGFYTEAPETIGETTPTSLIASTTPQTATTTIPAPIIAIAVPTFRDMFVDNEPVRAFGGFDQTPLLYYSFPNNNILIIATTQAALQEIFKRLTTTQFVR